MSSQYKIMDEKCGVATCRFGPFHFNVKKMALAISWLSFAHCLLGIVWSLMGKYPNYYFNIALGLMNLLWTFIYLGVIEGVRRRRPTLFLPYLILTGINLVFNMLYLIVVVVIGIWAPRQLVDWLNQKIPEHKITTEEFRVYMLLYALFCAIFFALNAWCYSVIYRAYKRLKNAQKSSILAI